MRTRSTLLILALLSGFSLTALTPVSADVIVVQKDHPHYAYRNGYYWDGNHAYRRVWIASNHRYDYRPVVVAPRRVVVVPDNHVRVAP